MESDIRNLVLPLLDTLVMAKSKFDFISFKKIHIDVTKIMDFFADDISRLMQVHSASQKDVIRIIDRLLAEL